ncbi:MAG: SH3 domain-containing protein [Pseudomonadota bacterium]
MRVLRIPKRVFLGGLAFCALVCVCLVALLVQDRSFVPTHVVDTYDDPLSYRSGPGVHYRKLGEVPRGVEVERLRTDGSWFEVRLPRKRTGWVHSGFLVALDGPAADEEGRTRQAALASALPMPDPADGTYALYERALYPIRELIADAEAGPAQYNAVVHSADTAPPRLPTDLTIAEILDWGATQTGDSAIGRYQVIENTLRGFHRRAGLSRDTVFTPPVQDKMANYLIMRRGLWEFLNGRISRDEFQVFLAMEWAGIPTPDGQSYHAGINGNRATVHVRQVTAALDAAKEAHLRFVSERLAMEQTLPTGG